MAWRILKMLTAHFDYKDHPGHPTGAFPASLRSFPSHQPRRTRRSDRFWRRRFSRFSRRMWTDQREGEIKINREVNYSSGLWADWLRAAFRCSMRDSHRRPVTWLMSAASRSTFRARRRFTIWRLPSLPYALHRHANNSIYRHPHVIFYSTFYSIFLSLSFYLSLSLSLCLSIHFLLLSVCIGLNQQ